MASSNLPKISTTRKNIRHPLATYLRICSTVQETTFGARAGFRQKVAAVDGMLGADMFKADVAQSRFDAMSPKSRKRAKPTPDDYLRKCFAVRFREYCQVAAQEDQLSSEQVVEWVKNHGADEIKRREVVPAVLAIWHEVTSVTISESVKPQSVTQKKPPKGIRPAARFGIAEEDYFGA